MTGPSSLSVSTRSPATTAPPACAFMAVHEPSANAGLIDTPAAVTRRSPRGIPYRRTSPGCMVPVRPKAESTRAQSIAGACACALSYLLAAESALDAATPLQPASTAVVVRYQTLLLMAESSTHLERQRCPLRLV